MAFVNKTLPFLIVLFITALYSPGVSGPFLFDDQTSITQNPAVAINEISSKSIHSVVESGISGPLKRPIAMVSFALNYYYAGGYKVEPFKITNIIIHCINALLIYLLAQQLLKISYPDKKNLFWFAAAISLFWGAHPINLTSVLYIVQRMTSLSTLFSLSCIILYLYARQHTIQKGLNWKSLVLFFSSALSLVFALFSKENAILIPLIIMAAELLLFVKQSPWKYYPPLTKTNKQILWLIVFTILAYCLNYAIAYASGGFSTRPFTMIERVLTETRVVSSYISLIFIPQINGFGLFHDDIALSTNLFTPWTTISSIVFLISLMSCAYFYRKKHPLFTFGIAWFFIGHLLESTFFPLEIAHEHRNNLPSIGIIIAVISLFISNTVTTKKTILSLFVPIVIVGSITLLRATQWSNAYDQAYYETVHHPKSPAAHSIFSYAAFNQGRVNEALIALRKSITLAPNEPAYSMFYQHALAVTKQGISAELQQQTLEVIRNGQLTPTTKNALEQTANCLKTIPCKPLQKNYLQWVNASIKKHPKDADLYYFKGKAYLAVNDDKMAVKAFQKGSKINPNSLHHLIQIANIFIRKRDIESLEKIIGAIDAANKRATAPKNEALSTIKESLNTLKRMRSDAKTPRRQPT
ncbi:MAG: hypothetical protein RPS47_12555 [Colwellia sp.]|jgi:hypothetical protein